MYEPTYSEIKNIVERGLTRLPNALAVDDVAEARAYGFYFIELYWLSLQTSDDEAEALRKRIEKRLRSCHERIYAITGEPPLLEFAGVGTDESSFIPCYACGGCTQFWDQNEGIISNLLGFGAGIGMDFLFGKLDTNWKEIMSGIEDLSGKSVQRPQPYHPFKPNFTGQKFCETCEALATSEKACLRAARHTLLGDYIESSNSAGSWEAVEFNWKGIEFSGQSLRSEWKNHAANAAELLLKKMDDPYSLVDKSTIAECRFVLDCVQNLAERIDHSPLRRQTKSIIEEWDEHDDAL